MVRVMLELKAHQPVLRRHRHPLHQRVRDYTFVRIVTANSPIVVFVASVVEQFRDQWEADIYRTFHWLYHGDVRLYTVWLQWQPLAAALQ